MSTAITTSQESDSTSYGSGFMVAPSMKTRPSISTGVKTPGKAMLAWTAGCSGPLSKTTARRPQKSVAKTDKGMARSSKVEHDGFSHNPVMIDSLLSRPL